MPIAKRGMAVFSGRRVVLTMLLLLAERVAPFRFNRHLSRHQFAYPSTLSSATLSAAPTDEHIATRVVDVGLADRSYPIYIGRDYFSQKADGLAAGTFASETLRRHVVGKNVLVVTNDRVGPLHLEKVVSALKADSALVVETVVLPDGEEEKTIENIMKIMDTALDKRMDRRSTFVALGGGVIGDMVGFAAAIYQRGVAFIQVPTTVMAMVDSSVGGKTGVNHPSGKNMIGSFHQPQCVLIDIGLLDTLPDRELSSGLSEVVKYGLIRDADFFEWIEENMAKIMARDPAALACAIERSCINKAEVVAQDEREGGVRATLNLGHTFGHAIETGLGYGTWLHGEAVSAGTVMAADMSASMGWIDESLVERATALLEKANLPVGLPEGCTLTEEDFRKTMAIDKKVADGVLRLILLKGPLGGCEFTGDYDRDALEAIIKKYVRHGELLNPERE